MLRTPQLARSAVGSSPRLGCPVVASARSSNRDQRGRLALALPAAHSGLRAEEP